ncbi:adenosylcobinamide-GDP ribazoletransferase [Aminipila butyrica]|uniref:Adenosylcobinamide-GDP ribazoletransferase n=1 Tax=Aminipila butyrica TaxID=433296 RepID=A0A858C1E4_9FIRM|nr:adenosylcobinamide-GDP ribazoletransferase [Aminipila butyrica]QIB70336.1 adenosylcobinamide-GDP ribazoletransferase [Aminipila butyrica]
MKYLTAFFMAWGNFFAVPCPCKWWDNELRRLQLVFFPLIGLLMGGLWYGLYWVMALVGIPLPLQAAVLAIYPFIISGFIHLDGFMDCCDAILSRRDLAERQRILKDSHVGAFSVISVAILFLLSFAAAWCAVDPAAGPMEDVSWKLTGLVVIPLVSRACSGYGVLNFVPIGHSQYKASYDQQINRKYGIVLNLMIAAAILLPAFLLKQGLTAAIAAGITVIVHHLMMGHGRRQLGGMSGDISGYALTIAECAGLLTLAVL